MKRSERNRIGKAVVFFIAAALWLTAAGHGSAAFAEETPLYKNPSALVEGRITDLLGRMTLEEKIGMVSGDPATGFETLANARLGIPKFSMTDGPLGVRWEKSVAFPASVTMAAGWNEESTLRVGEALGRETLAKGRNVLLGPCINIHRQPFGGRNFESFSEDPYLSARMAVAYVKGVQSQGAVATPKHYVANNQEWQRSSISSEVDERTMREIYLPHFEAAIREGGAWSVMSSYNRLNGTYASEHPWILTDVLKKEWGFRGFVMSDWGAVHSTEPTALAGLDLEMPSGAYLGGGKLLEAVRAGRVPETQIDDMVRRILRALMETGHFDGKVKSDPAWANSEENQRIALDAAREGITLLKNENGALPLKRGEVRKIAIIGPNANVARVGGGGSSQVDPARTVSPMEGLKALAGDGVTLAYAAGAHLSLDVDFEAIDAALLKPGNLPGNGWQARYYSGKEMAGDPAFEGVETLIDYDWGGGNPHPGVTGGDFSVRWTAALTAPETGEYELTAIADGIGRVYVNKKLKVDVWGFQGSTPKTTKVKLQQGKTYELKVEYRSTGSRALMKFGWKRPGRDSIQEAARLAAGSDAAVIFAGLDRDQEGEGNDRETLELPGRQGELIQAVAEANPRTIVVLYNGTPVAMDPWLDKTAAVIEAWYPGQEGGTAIAEILFGDVNPSGKSPVTFPRRWEDSPAYGNFPGGEGVVKYEEGIFVGYRGFDAKNVEPLFPFGHGLSYTSFEYGPLTLMPEKAPTDGVVTAAFQLKNTGPVAGAEAAQIYVRDVEASVPRPPRELKAFRKVFLEPGESTTVAVDLDRSAFSFWSPALKEWTVEPGKFEIQVGSSSRDIRLKGEATLE